MRKFEGFTKGINLGGWLSQSSLAKKHLDTFITPKDIQRIAAMGVDHVRLPIDFELIEDEEGNIRESGYAYIQNAIDWCLDAGLNVVLDLHKTAGYVFDDSEYSSGFFSSEKLQSRFVNLWNKLAGRFGKYYEHVAFELLNEIVDEKCADKWNEIAKRAIRTIRTIAPKVWIIVGGTRSNSVISVKELGRPYDNRIVYTFHCYEPLIFTHQAAYWVENMPSDYRVDYPETVKFYLSENYRLIDRAYAYPIEHLADMTCGKDFFKSFFLEALEVAEQYDVPLYCGEYGVIDQASPEATLRWFQDIHAIFEKYGISRAVWSYKEMNFGLIDRHYAPIYEKLLECL